MAYLEDEKLGQKALKALSSMKGALSKRVSHEQKVMESEGIMLACQLFEEAKEAYENGEMKWKEAVDELHQNLLAIPDELFTSEGEQEEED